MQRVNVVLPGAAAHAKALTARLMELERNVGVDAEREVVVDHVQWQIVLTIARVRHRGVRFHLQAPAIEQYRVGVADVGQNLTDRLVGIALRKGGGQERD